METKKEVPESSLPVVEKRTWLANSFQQRLSQKKGDAIRLRTGIDEKQKWLENANKKHSPAVGKRSSPAGKRSKSVTEKDISSNTLNSIRSERSASVSGLEFIKVENKWLEEELYKKKHIDRALEVNHDKQTQEAAAKELEKILNSNDFSLGITPPPLEDETLIEQTTDADGTTETQLETSVYYAGDVTEVKAFSKLIEQGNIQSTNTDVGAPSPAIVYFAGDVNEACELTPLPSEEMRQNNVVSLSEHDESSPHDEDPVNKNLENEFLSAEISTEALATNDIQNTLETSVEVGVESSIGLAETSVFKVLDMQVDNDSNHVDSTFDSSNVILQTTNSAIECSTENEQNNSYQQETPASSVEPITSEVKQDIATPDHSNAVTSGTDCESTQQNSEDHVPNENSFSGRPESEDTADVGAEALSSNVGVDETNEAHSTDNDPITSVTAQETEEDAKAESTTIHETIVTTEPMVHDDPLVDEGENQYLEDPRALCHSPTSKGDVEVETAFSHDTFEVPTDIDGLCHSPTSKDDVEVEPIPNQDACEVPPNVEGICHSPTYNGDVEIETTLSQNNYEVPNNVGNNDTGIGGNVEIQHKQNLSDETKDGIQTPLESTPMATIEQESNNEAIEENHLQESVEVEALIVNEADRKPEQRLDSMEIVIHDEIEEAKEEHSNSRINTDLAIEHEEPSVEICDKADDDIEIGNETVNHVKTLAHENCDESVSPVVITTNVSETCDKKIEVEEPMPLNIDKEVCDDQSRDLVGSAITLAIDEKQEVEIKNNNFHVNNSENSDSPMLDHIVVLSQSSVADDLTFVTDLRVDNEHVPDNTIDACQAEAIESQQVKSSDVEESSDRSKVNTNLEESNILHEEHSNSIAVVDDPAITNGMVAAPAPLETNCTEGVVQAVCDDLVQTSADQTLPTLEKKSNVDAKDKEHSNDNSNTKALSGFLFRVKIQEASISEGSQSPSKFNLARVKSSEHAEPKIIADDNTKSIVTKEPTAQITDNTMRSEHEKCDIEAHAEEDYSAPPALAASSTSSNAMALPDDVPSAPAANAPLSAESIEQALSKSPSTTKPSEIISVPATNEVQTSDVEDDNSPQHFCLKLQSTRSIIDGFKAELAASSSSFDNENTPDEEPLKKPSSVKNEEPDVGVGVHCLESCSIM